MFSYPKRSTRTLPNSGFSLVELVVAILLLITLAGIAITKLSSAGEGAEEKVAKQELRMIYKAIMGDEKSVTGYYHETRLEEDERIPKFVAYLIDRALVESQFPTTDFTWDPNNRRGYRENGYLIGDGMETVQLNGGGQHDFPSMVDPWGTPYKIKQYQDSTNARVVSYGPNKTTVNDVQDDEDDIVLWLKR